MAIEGQRRPQASGFLVSTLAGPTVPVGLKNATSLNAFRMYVNMKSNANLKNMANALEKARQEHFPREMNGPPSAPNRSNYSGSTRHEYQRAVQAYHSNLRTWLKSAGSAWWRIVRPKLLNT